MKIYLKTCLIFTIILFASTSFAQKNTDNIDSKLLDFGLKYRFENNIIYVDDKKEDINYVIRYLESIFLSMKAKDINNTDLEKVIYKAQAPNLFEYAPSYGLRWAPHISDQYLQSGLLFLEIEPPNSGEIRMKFARLVPQSDDILDNHPWIIPAFWKSNNDEKEPPPVSGYKWNYFNIEKFENTEKIKWYIPQTWENAFNWNLSKLEEYELIIDKKFIMAYLDLEDNTKKAKKISDLIAKSIWGKTIDP